MEPLQIALIVLVVAAVWAVVELAVTLRRSRSTMDQLDKTVDELNETIAETKPVIAKLDGTLDDIQPAISRVEPLLESANVAVDALSANLVEVEAVVRDVSSLTGAAATAGSAVSGVADSASEAVQRFLNRKKGAADPARALDPAADAVQPPAPESAAGSQDDEAGQKSYYTYESERTGAPEPAAAPEEADHE